MPSLVLEYLPSGKHPQDPLTGLQAPTCVLPRGSGPLSSNYLHVQSPFTAGPKSSSDWGRGWGVFSTVPLCLRWLWFYPAAGCRTWGPVPVESAPGLAEQVPVREPP